MALKAEEVYAILKKQIQSGGGTPGPAGVGIQKIEKTGTEELVDTYTITYTNGQTSTYTVTNGANGKDGSPGAKGDPGQDGITPTIGENGNWYLGEEDTGKPSRGEKGDPGQKGDPGDKGDPGETGATPNIQIGTVQTLEPGQQATASMSGTVENPLLNLGIPKGQNGQSGTADIPRQQMQNTDTTVTLEPNILYVFPEMSSLTITLAEPSDTDIVNEWHWFFDSGETACVFTLQNQDGSQVYTDAYSIDANMRYEVSVLNNVAYIKGVAISAT